MSRFLLILICAVAVACCRCGVPKPQDAYSSAPDLLGDVTDRRQQIRSFRMIGRIDSYGEDQRVAGKIYVFGELPDRLRVELVSPFGSPLSVLTVDQKRFALHDHRQGRYLKGPADPCNIARLIRIPLPAPDVARVLIGHTPLLDGPVTIEWDRKGVYRLTIEESPAVQYLDIGPDRSTLPLYRSRLVGAAGEVFDMTYDRWKFVGSIAVPREIRVKMPGEQIHLLVRYDANGVELNVDLPGDAWSQTPPAGIVPTEVTCDGSGGL